MGVRTNLFLAILTMTYRKSHLILTRIEIVVVHYVVFNRNDVVIIFAIFKINDIFTLILFESSVLIVFFLCLILVLEVVLVIDVIRRAFILLQVICELLIPGIDVSIVKVKVIFLKIIVVILFVFEII